MSIQTDSRRLKALTLSLSISAAMAATAVQAAPNDQQTIEALRAQLQQMQQRLDRLEQQQASAQTTSSGNTAASNSGSNGTSAKDSGSRQTAASANSDNSGASALSMAEQNKATLDEMQQVEFSGMVEFGYSYQDWSESSKDKAGDLDFNKLVLAIDGEHDDFLYSMEYRFYNGYNFLKKGWLGYKVDDENTVKAGLVQTPFGNMPYGYLGWYGNLPYLAGFNDNQNAGVLWERDAGPWNTSLAFFKSDNLGDDNQHYGANAIGSSEQGNSEENQLAARAAYTFGHGTDYTTEVNASVKGGQLYNNNTNDSGSNWSAALGVSGSYGNWLAMAQATTYKYDAENAPESETQISDNVVQVGAFNFNYLIPAEAEMYTASLGYSMDVDWGPVENIYFYNDFSYINPRGDYSPYNGGFGDVDNPMFNDIGLKLTAGPYYLWADIASNKNGLGYFGSGDANKWNTQFITTFGFNF
ncbi:hypothetical protein [Kushneria konosiri]|uniref:Porin n=1 Tax=Kushneria konosiri TaxID=698828 RepID=A0A2Z2HDY8_9GAMM|nr:hypothetical protein [Kushneria konosiri]ARS51481.1 hypothetical protein B9G99_00020 [Kushneria konosiri]